MKVKRLGITAILVAISFILTQPTFGQESYQWITTSHNELNTITLTAEAPHLSADKLTIYYGRRSSDWSYEEIAVATRTSDQGSFTLDRVLTELGDNVSSPWLSADGLRLYYYELLPADGTRWLCMATWNPNTSQWVATTIFSEIHLSGYQDVNPSLTSDELTLFYDSLRPDGQGGKDIWMATRATINDPFTNPVNVSELNSSRNEVHPFVLADGLTIYYSADDPEAGTNFNLYKATRVSTIDPFSNISPVDNLSEAGIYEGMPYVSEDKKTFLYTQYYSVIMEYHQVPATCPSMDLTGDCRVDIDDLAILTSEWLDPYDMHDFSDMAAQWFNDPAFVTTWNTNMGDGTTVTLGLAGTVDADIDWGDGSPIEHVTTIGPHVHDYGVNGLFTVSVTGSVTAYNSDDNGGSNSECAKLIRVENWGQVCFTRMSYAFDRCINLTYVPPHSNGLEMVTRMNFMFGFAEKFNNDISGWDTSNVTDMHGMFYCAYVFNQDIGGWNTSGVSDMSSMFTCAHAFNQDIGNWDTSQVEYMGSVFFSADTFNQDLNNWDTSNVHGMSGMFNMAKSFNGNISNWDTSGVYDMSSMFSSAESFNQDIGNWNTSGVRDMNSMFGGADSFNQDISNWNTSQVEYMDEMFRDNEIFNQDIGDWDTSNVRWMTEMFCGASAFNQDIGGWNTSKVINMDRMFAGANAFDQDIGGWDTSNVTNMRGMFSWMRRFNQDISGWDTSKVTNMNSMFEMAESFNQDLSGWCVSLIPSKPSNFDDCADSWSLPRPVWGTCP